MGTEVGNGFTLESFFVDQLKEFGGTDTQSDLNIRLALNVNAIRTADTVGYFEEIPPECKSANPPLYCLIAARGLISQVNLGVINGLVANGFLEPRSRKSWHVLANTRNLVDFAPNLFRQIRANKKDWSLERGMEILERSFTAVSRTAYPVPGSDLERYCEEHPEDPLCRIAAPLSTRGAHLTQDFLVVSELYRDRLLQDQQVRSIYDASYKTFAGPRSTVQAGVIVSGMTDMDPAAAGIVVEGLKLDEKQRGAIALTLGAGTVGLVDPDSPWADVCFSTNPPRWCRYASQFAVARTLTTELIRYKIWDKQVAVKVFNKLGEAIDALAIRN